MFLSAGTCGNGGINKSLICISTCLPIDPKQTVLKAAEEWKNAQVKASSSRLYHTITLAWKKPDLHVFKLNIDGTRSGASEKIGAGGVLRNHRGDWIAGFQVNLGIGEILDAETWVYFMV